jgi:hypothetical protein
MKGKERKEKKRKGIHNDSRFQFTVENVRDSRTICQSHELTALALLYRLADF